jgi:N-acetylmuramoyl-L-alanine amidase
MRFLAKEKIKITIYKLFFFSLIFLYLSLILSYLTEAKDFIEVKDIRHSSLSKGIRVILEFSEKVDFKIGRLSNPERLYFDIKDAKLKNNFNTYKDLSDKYIKSIRVAQFNSTTVRIVFDMNISGYHYKVLNNDSNRLIIDIYSNQDNEKEEENQLSNSINFFKKKIVLDPGHGGNDPGAIGPTGLREKDVVLDIAKKAKEIIIKNYPNYEVVMTRDEDIFIPLSERTAVANRVDADLFLSIHANASPNKFARGIETFILNWTDDEESMKVAARENAISLSAMKKAQNELGLILASLEREAKRDESVKLAGYVHNALINSLEGFDMHFNRNLKQALFYVLVGAKMPCALVEVGFISNLDEERQLADESHRERIARSIVMGINRYIVSTQIGPQRIVMH